MMPRNRAALANIYKSDGMAASSPQKLLILLFERLESDLDRAITAIDAGQVEPAHKALINAQDIVFELQMALDPEAWPNAAELYSIYEYILGLLVDANASKTVEPIHECLTAVKPLTQAWNDAYQALRVDPQTPPTVQALTPAGR